MRNKKSSIQHLRFHCARRASNENRVNKVYMSYGVQWLFKRCNPFIRAGGQVTAPQSFTAHNPVSKKFSENPFMQVPILERLPVIHIARSKIKIQEFSLVVDNQEEFKTIEPANRTWLLLRFEIS